MPIGGERAAVQNPFLRYAEEAGWTYLTPDEALLLRRGVTSPILDSVFIEQLPRLSLGGYTVRYRDDTTESLSPKHLLTRVGEAEYYRLAVIAHRLPGHWHKVA